MKLKQILILASILTVLILGVCVKELHKPAELADHEYAPLQLSFEPAAVEKILIQKDTETLVELAGDGGEWKIPGLWNARANQNKIENFMKEIRSAKGEVRANDPALLGDFGITTDQALRVSLLDKTGSPAAHFLIGTKRAGYGFVFLRSEDSNTVYLAPTGLLEPMGIYGDLQKQTPAAEAWADLAPFHFEPSAVTKIEAKRFREGKEIPTIAVESAKEGDRKEWRSAGKGVSLDLASDKVETFLFSLTQTQATKVLDPASFDFTQPLWQMALTLEGGEGIVVKAVAKDKESKEPSNYILQVSSEPVLFMVSKYYFEMLDTEENEWTTENR